MNNVKRNNAKLESTANPPQADSGYGQLVAGECYSACDGIELITWETVLARRAVQMLTDLKPHVENIDADSATASLGNVHTHK